MHEGDGVVPWWQTFDFEFAVRTADRIERALHYVDEHAHPGMLVALHRQQNFLACEALFDWCCLRGLRFIPLAIVLWSGVNVVCGGIAVNDPDGLSGHQADDVGHIFASPLRQSNGIFWNIERAIAESLLHIDEDVLEVSSGNNDVLSGVRPLA